MKVDSFTTKLRFLELMQKCLPFRWQKYWDCGAKDFDLLMLFQDIGNTKLSLQERLLLSLLARIWLDGEVALDDLARMTGPLAEDHRQIITGWMEEGYCKSSRTSSYTDTSEQFDPAALPIQKIR